MGEDRMESVITVLNYLEAMEYISRHRIPFEEWPPELQAMAGVTEELLGKNAIQPQATPILQ